MVARQYGLIFQYASKGQVVVNGGVAPAESKALVDVGQSDDMQLSMLVDIGQLMEQPEGIIVGGTSLVRLESFDDDLGCRLDADNSTALPGSHRAIEDRELGGISNRLREGIAHVGDGQFKGEMIEGVSEILDRIPGDQRKSEVDRSSQLSGDNGLLSVRVDMSGNSVRLSREPP